MFLAIRLTIRLTKAKELIGEYGSSTEIILISWCRRSLLARDQRYLLSVSAASDAQLVVENVAVNGCAIAVFVSVPGDSCQGVQNVDHGLHFALYVLSMTVDGKNWVECDTKDLLVHGAELIVSMQTLKAVLTSLVQSVNSVADDLTGEMLLFEPMAYIRLYCLEVTAKLVAKCGDVFACCQ